MFYLKKIVGALILSVSILLPAQTIANADQEIIKNTEIREAFISTKAFRKNINANNLVEAMSHFFNKIDRNKNGITKAELVFRVQKDNAFPRSNIISRVLLFDLNADGSVSTEELVQGFIYEKRRKIDFEYTSSEITETEEFKRYAKVVLDADPNGDGQIEPSEYRSLKINKQINQLRYHNKKHVTFAKILLKYDPNMDGKITQQEALKLISEALEEYNFSKK